MSPEEYFKDWYKFINKSILQSTIKKINEIYKVKLCEPKYANIFKVFNVTDYTKVKQVWLGMEPYNNPNYATGIAFANPENTESLSPSLNVLKESLINFEIPHNHIIFDPELRHLTEQGILLLNSALTVERKNPNSHTYLWRDFTSSFLREFSLYNPGIIYVLWGEVAKSYENCIKNGIIFKEKHPAWYARMNKKIPYEFFSKINNTQEYYYGDRIIWFNELK